MIRGINYFNPKIREEVLNRRLGVYPMKQNTYSLDYGEFNINDSKQSLEKYKYENGLLEATNNINVVGATDGYTGNVRRNGYMKQWDKNNNHEIVNVYSNIEHPSQELVKKWNDKERNEHTNYVDYIKSVYGTDSGLINVLGGIVTGKGVGLSLGDNNVGIVSNFDVEQTLAGRIYSTVTGKDTPLGKFGMKAAAVSIFNRTVHKANVELKQGIDWLRGKITFWDKNDDTKFGFYDKSISVSKNSNVLNYIGEMTDLYNSARKSRLDNESSIFFQDHIEKTLIPDFNTFVDDNSVKNHNSKYQNESLIENTGKLTVGFIYNVLNLNKYSPNYEIDSRIRKSSVVLKPGYNVDNLIQHSESFYRQNPRNYNASYLAWQEKKDSPDSTDKTYNDGNYYGIADAVFFPDENSLVHKTKELFKKRKINSIVSGFGNSFDNREDSITQSAVHDLWGMSKGRNLIKKKYWDRGNIDESDKSAGYDNPYCRVWTWHHQYRKINNLIRPFTDENGLTIDVHDSIPYIRPGADNLKNYGVLQDNGFVKIAPYGLDMNSATETDMKQYMFSIENLAWKDVNRPNNLTNSQIGPEGGRLMWFPPYGLKFNENVNVSWNSNQFIGRGEPVYTYSNTERSGTLDFIILTDHPSIINYRSKSYSPEDEEQALLRFFAGCDILDTGDIYPKTYELSETNVTHTKNESAKKGDSSGASKTNPNNIENVEPTPPNIEDDKPTALFNVFFPNDYSGVDDTTNNAIDYLLTYETDGYTLANIEGLSCSTSDAEILKQNWMSTKKDKWYKRDNISNYNAKNLKDCYDVGKLPRGRYHNLNSYWDLENHKLNDTKNGALFSFSEVTGLVGEEGFIKLIKDAKKVEFVGKADINGYSSDNRKLAKNRATLIKNYLQNETGIDMSDETKFEIKIGDLPIRLSETTFVNCASSKGMKQDRSVQIVIYKETANVVTIEEAIQPHEEVDTNEVGITAKKTTFDNHKDYMEAVEEAMGESVPRVRRVSKPRYEDESGFFQYLANSDEFVQSAIRDKIKYFQPAFHSTTPEGLNARLTFLHQCTRQGPTTTAGDVNTSSTTNLAFGRPPICVLRIGDFYNTKIIITGMSINYEQMWDLNPEGIGVQPMMANVTLNFTFIGGSDLSGPIARLQNAITNNFYANTSVFDDRSDYRVVNVKDGVEDKTNDGDDVRQKETYAPLYHPHDYTNVGSETSKIYKVNNEMSSKEDVDNLINADNTDVIYKRDGDLVGQKMNKKIESEGNVFATTDTNPIEKIKSFDIKNPY